MIIKALAIAAAAGAISTAAFAQDYNRDTTSAQAPTTVNPAPPTEQSTVQSTAPTGATSDVVAISPEQARAQGIPVETVASAPVPDTAANRAKYGAPMSNAGKNTPAKGN